MVQIQDICDPFLMAQMIAGGYVTARRHNQMPWTILNYTPKAQYEWKWNEATLKARGLVYNHETGEVVARPFEKFFNWDQGTGTEVWHNPMPPTGPVVRMEKMDGSLGVLCAQYLTSELYDGPTFEWIATRGSFHSEQAEWATQFYTDTIVDQQHMPPGNLFIPKRSKTYLFEIIFPENRIVVDYGDYKGLVLIDVIDTETGHSDLQEFDDCLWPDKVKRVVLNHGFDSGQASDIPDGDEGFVYLWPNINYRVKMKSAQYIELHRLVSHLSEKSVWEAMVAGKTLGEIKDGLPDEFHKFVDDTYDKIVREATMILFDVAKEWLKVQHLEQDRKAFALAIKDNPYRKYLFLMLDGKDCYGVALASVKPKSDKTLVSEEDV